MSYQGLSRIYRPQLFSEVTGQDAIITTLKHALLLKKTAQAYLFSGSRGTGKTTLARILAKALNCKSLSSDGEPCNQCSSCSDITLGKSLAIFEIDGASNRGIDDIRQLNTTASYASTSSGYTVFIIDEAHMLTKEAFNALLKTLEEPPPYVKFFLATTESHKIPPTILSRCQRFDLQRISSIKILEKLKAILIKEQIAFEEEALYRIANLSDGSMRVAESNLDQLLCFGNGEIKDDFVCKMLSLISNSSLFSLDKAFDQHAIHFAFELAQEVFSSGKEFSHFLESLMDHYRNILAIHMNVSLSELSPNLEKQYKSQAKYYTQEQVLYILDYLMDQHQKSYKSVFRKILLEMVLLHIIRSKHKIYIEDLISELEKQPSTPILEKPLPPKIEPATTQPKHIDTRSDTIMRFAAVELEGSLKKF